MAPEVVRALHHWGFSVRADPTSKFATENEPGRADLMIVRHGLGGFIEVKNGRQSFPFAALRPNQRTWIETYCLAQPFCNPCFVWLSLGLHPPTYDAAKYLPRRAWLVPYLQFLEVERRVAPHATYLPYRAGKGERIALQEQGFDATRLLSPFALYWDKGGWLCPPSSSFYSHFRLGAIADDDRIAG